MTRDSSASFTWGNRLRYGWTGREYDAETGLYYLRARYYSPTQRRFLAEDPVASGLSPYAYVGGSPLEATDPSGMLMSYAMRMTDPALAFKLSTGASADARLDGLMGWGGETYNRYASAGGLYATVANGDGSTRQVACSTLNGACDEWLAAHGGSRPLTTNEAQAVKAEFPGLNTDAARVAYDSPSDRSAFTPRNTMHFPAYTSDCQDFITCKNGSYAGWFIHEATHVWQYQTGRSPFWGHILSEDVFTFSGDYLPRDGMSGYMNLTSGNGLSTEKEADWHQRHYELCTVRRNPDACAWR